MAESRIGAIPRWRINGAVKSHGRMQASAIKVIFVQNHAHNIMSLDCGENAYSLFTSSHLSFVSVQCPSKGIHLNQALNNQ